MFVYSKSKSIIIPKITSIFITFSKVPTHTKCILYLHVLGILHKGDGTNIYLKERPRKVLTVMGNGKPRKLECRGCDGRADDQKLMAPVALASGRDGSLYVGDFNHIRKLSANRQDVASILQLRYILLNCIHFT